LYKNIDVHDQISRQLIKTPTNWAVWMGTKRYIFEERGKKIKYICVIFILAPTSTESTLLSLGLVGQLTFLLRYKGGKRRRRQWI
jgi:hypothetical protein